MPKYQYACPDCNHESEQSHLMKECDTIVITCDRCGTRMNRVPQSTAAIQGFYTTHENPVWYSNLARKMPKGQKDPKAWFTSRAKALDYAKKLADQNGGSVVKA